MRGLSLLLVSALMLGACTDKEQRVFFDGKYFPAKAKKVKGDREAFVVTVRKTAQGLNGAREAGRHAAVKYCVENFGYSGIDWISGPDAKDGSPMLSKGNLVLKGRCRVWE
ncbi:hypothetical protein [uncultured Roseovarius sp.]|uniref:hypothetical protein n=1 Tax=uncultured Roseovarius sp. TaxID=293344 RepID=UPI00260E4E41|nr:hypothetical protein [uncultured Roseovarius sp.]